MCCRRGVAEVRDPYLRWELSDDLACRPEGIQHRNQVIGAEAARDPLYVAAPCFEVVLRRGVRSRPLAAREMERDDQPLPPPALLFQCP